MRSERVENTCTHRVILSKKVKRYIFITGLYLCYNVSLISDVAFPNGIAGGYLFLGNMVYTVSLHVVISEG